MAAVVPYVFANASGSIPLSELDADFVYVLQQLGGSVVVTAPPFNADPSGATDSTAAIQAALNSFVAGGVCFFPPGVYKVSSLSVPQGVILRGSGPFATALKTSSASATLLTMGLTSGVTEIQLGASVSRTTGYFIDTQSNSTLIQRVEMTGHYIGIHIGTLGGAQPSDVQILDCSFFNPAIVLGGGGILAENFSNLVIDGVVMTGPASGTQPDFGIRPQNGDTAFLSNTNVTAHGVALQIDPGAGYNCFALSAVNCAFDSGGTNSGGTVSSAEIIPAGGVYNTKFSNCWFGLSAAHSGCSISPSGSGVVDGISFAGCDFPHNGDCGLLVVNSGSAVVKNWVVTGGGSGGNTNAGIRAAGGTSYFTITGHAAGNYSGRGNNNDGIVVDAAGSDFYFITGNNVQGNTTAGIVDAGTGTSAQVTNNAGYNGSANVGAVSVGASPWSYTAGHTSETLYVTGGTVSSIAIDGTLVQATTGSTVPLVPNETMTITYSGLPTVLRKRA